MRNFALTLGLLFWGFAASGIESSRRVPEARHCFTQLPVLMGVSDSPKLAKSHPPLSLPILEKPYGPSRAADYAAHYYAPKSPREDGYTPKGFTVADFESQLRQFARDSVDQRSVTYVSPLRDSTRIKLHLLTGDLLIMNKKGEVGLFTRLPVGQRSIAALPTTEHLFGLLVGTQTTKAQWPREPETFARLTAGESLPYEDFTSRRALADHVDKHVLVLSADRRHLSPRAKAAYVGSRRRPLATDFAFLWRPFLAAVSACEGDLDCEQDAYDTMVSGYQAQVVRYMKSRKPSILTYTQFDNEIQNGFAITQATGYRFDPLTNEMAVFNRVTGKMLSYFHLDLITGNRWMASHGYGVAHSPFEYFLALVSCHRRHPTRQLADQNCHPDLALALP